MSGSVLLDTNIVIGLFANDQAILARLSKTDHIFIPSIVLEMKTVAGTVSCSMNPTG